MDTIQFVQNLTINGPIQKKQEDNLKNSHPIQQFQNNKLYNKEQTDMIKFSQLYGSALPIILTTERNIIGQQFNNLELKGRPIGLEILMDKLDEINYEDFFGTIQFQLPPEKNGPDY
eukprot:TRINITY_DN4367_c0_g1_i1.p2 TRINITY_DN4367_c0_g1~~TRINITY_DN4367_c0_g1_i1.p2  ORF type:complete len:117 (-),score=26.99 TRINITY_DN4367_c0_g1_i1:285-635(-)